MKPKFSPLIAGLATTALLVSGCGSSSGDDESGETEAESTAITLGMAGEPPVAINAMFYVAQSEGFYEDEGLDVTLRPFATGADVGRAVQSGEIAGGLTGTNSAIALRAEGGSIKAVHGSEHPSYLVASSSGEITQCADLEGQTIAVDAQGAPKSLALHQMLASCDLTPEDVSEVNVGGPTTVDALVAGQVEVAVLHPDELAAVNAKIEASPVMTMAEVVPLSHYTLTITTEEQLADETSREKWLSVMRALAAAKEFIYEPANADEVAQIMADMTNRPVDIMSDALGDFIDIEFWPKNSAGLDEERLKATIQNQVDVGNIDADKAPTYDELIDPSVYADTIDD